MLRVIGIYNFEFRMFRPLVYRDLEDYIGFLLPHRRQSRHWLIFLSLFKLDLFLEPGIQIFFQLYAHRKRKSWQVFVRSFRMFQPLVYRDLEDYIGFLLLHWRQYRHWLIFLSLLKLNLFLEFTYFSSCTLTGSGNLGECIVIFSFVFWKNWG